MNDVLRRIFEELDAQKKSPTDMCKELNIASSTFFTWKSKDKIPSTEYLQDISKYLGKSIDYFVNGTLIENYYIDPEVQQIAEEMATRPEMKVLFKASRDMTKEQIEAINRMIDTMK